MSRGARAAGFFLVLLATLAVISPILPLPNPLELNLSQQFQGPNGNHWLGTDQNGSDILSRLLAGARISLGVALTVVILNVSIGLALGSAAGMGPRWMDQLLMRLVDLLYAFPGFLLSIALVSLMGPSIGNLIFALSLTGWAGYARLVRGEVLHLKNRDYVLAAMSLGASPARLLRVHIWPNLLGALVVQATFGMAGTILAESSLSFLGLGAPPQVPTWGSMLFVGRTFLMEAPHVSIFPGLAIASVVLCFNILGDWLRDEIDPRTSR